MAVRCMKLTGCWEALCCDNETALTGTVVIELISPTYINPGTGLIEPESLLGPKVVYPGTGQPIAERTILATIDADGCWESCELPCNDSLVPGTSFYKVTEQAARTGNLTDTTTRVTLIAANCCAMGIEAGGTIDINNPPSPDSTGGTNAVVATLTVSNAGILTFNNGEDGNQVFDLCDLLPCADDGTPHTIGYTVIGSQVGITAAQNPNAAGYVPPSGVSWLRDDNNDDTYWTWTDTTGNGTGNTWVEIPATVIPEVPKTDCVRWTIMPGEPEQVSDTVDGYPWAGQINQLRVVAAGPCAHDTQVGLRVNGAATFQSVTLPAGQTTVTAATTVNVAAADVISINVDYIGATTQAGCSMTVIACAEETI